MIPQLSEPSTEDYSSARGSWDMWCVICQNKVDQWAPYGVPRRIGKCPYCGSKGRHREMGLFLLNLLSKKSSLNILEIGPSQVTTASMINKRFLGNSKYTAIDIRRLKHHANLQAPHRFIEMDATKMTFPSETFDLVICNHVLPYAPDDKSIVSEIHRVLKKDGVAVLNSHVEEMPQTKSIEDLRSEDPIKYNEEYILENGVCREYGLDYEDRLRGWGFDVSKFYFVHGLSDEFIGENGLKPDSYIFLGRPA